MTKIFCTSDTHFSHINIIKYCNRPFASIEEHDEALRSNWNEVVSNDDFLLHMGDLTLLSKLSSNDRVRRIIESLKGKKTLVFGNHDSKHVRRSLVDMGWIVVQRIETSDVLFRHWPLSHNEPKKLCVHGHAHGKNRQAMHQDVGVDVYGFKPVLLERALTDLGFETDAKIEQVKQEVLEFLTCQNRVG